MACRHTPFPGLTDDRPVARRRAVSGLGEKKVLCSMLHREKTGSMISCRALSWVSMRDRCQGVVLVTGTCRLRYIFTDGAEQEHDVSIRLIQLDAA